MGRLSRSLLLSFAIFLTAGATVAAGQDVNVELHTSKRFGLRGAAANVIVGDPKIADVSLIDTNSVLLTGRAYGRTNVLVLDSVGRTLLDRYVNVVGAQDSQVTVYRGKVATDYNCTPRCVKPGASGAGGDESAGSSDGGGSSDQSSTTYTSKMTVSHDPG